MAHQKFHVNYPDEKKIAEVKALLGVDDQEASRQAWEQWRSRKLKKIVDTLNNRPASEDKVAYLEGAVFGLIDILHREHRSRA